jgi:hypothetical protein
MMPQAKEMDKRMPFPLDFPAADTYPNITGSLIIVQELRETNAPTQVIPAKTMGNEWSIINRFWIRKVIPDKYLSLDVLPIYAAMY